MCINIVLHADAALQSVQLVSRPRLDSGDYPVRHGLHTEPRTFAHAALCDEL